MVFTHTRLPCKTFTDNTYMADCVSTIIGRSSSSYFPLLYLLTTISPAPSPTPWSPPSSLPPTYSSFFALSPLLPHSPSRKIAPSSSRASSPLHLACSPPSPSLVHLLSPSHTLSSCSPSSGSLSLVAPPFLTPGFYNLPPRDHRVTVYLFRHCWTALALPIPWPLLPALFALLLPASLPASKAGDTRNRRPPIRQVSWNSFLTQLHLCTLYDGKCN